ncbi:MAG: flagellar motor protein MotB [Phycisphaerae bacterium]|nr:flagellar motor protein MotB [Phycisphaerae bacterium]
MPKYQEEPSPGVPEWMLTFSDCMTLLLTFFVLMISFSSFDEVDVFRKLRKIFSGQSPSIDISVKQTKDALLNPPVIHEEQQIDKGSEKPTLANEEKEGLKKETIGNFHDKKVFIADSAGIFWGNGEVLSEKGRAIMSILADFIKRVPNNIVICEKPVQDNGKQLDIGQQRAWSIIDYLCEKHGISYDRFMISSCGTIDNISSGRKNDRMIEIVLLERSFIN